MKQKWNEIVKARMKELKISRSQFAERMGISSPALGHWFNGSRNPNLEDIAKMFYLVGIDSVTLYSDGLVSLKEIHARTQIEGIAVTEILSEDEKGRLVGTEIDDKQFLDFRSNEPTAYAVQIKSQALMPRIKPNEYLVLERFRKLQTYDEVLVKLKTGEYFIKMFIAPPPEPGEPYALADLNKWLTSSDEPFYTEDIASIDFIAGIVKKNRLI